MARRWYRCGTLLIVLVGTAMPLREGQARLPRVGSETPVVSGTVQSTSADKLVLITDEGLSPAHHGAVRLTFVLTSETQLLWGMQRLAAVELRRGDVVIVRFHERSGEKIAEAVWALVARARELSPARTAEAEAEAAYARANRLLETAQVREALPYLHRAIGLQPGFLSAYSRRGFVYATLAVLEADHMAQQRTRERALADYTTAIVEGSKHGLMAAAWYNNRGVLYQQLQDHEHALQDFTAALRVDPTYILALQNRAQLRRALGDSEGAMADLTQVIGLEPEVGKWYCQRGTLWRRQEAMTQAQRDFQRCLTLDPSLREQYPETSEDLRHSPTVSR
jgi:tetratricopeptide (TPR) repeat protein